MKLERSLTLYTKINSKRIKDLNVRLDAIELLEENIGWIFLNHSKIFFDPPTRVMKINTILKWDLINLKKILHSKGNHKQKKKTAHRRGENICKQRIQKELISKVYKQLMKLNNNKKKHQTTQSKNGQKT